MPCDSKEPSNDALSKRRVRRRVSISAVAVAAPMIGLPIHGARLAEAQSVPTPRPLTRLASLNRSLAPSLGIFAYVNSRGLWMTTARGKLVHLSSDPHVATPGWSSDGRYLAYETSGPYGTHPVLDVYSVALEKVVFSQHSVLGFAWQPGYDLLAVWGSRSAVLAITGHGAHALGTLPAVDGDIIWSSNGRTLAFSRTYGSGPHRYDQVYAVSVSRHRLGPPQPLFRSPHGSGILPAAYLPNSPNILYWPDPLYSASLLADGTPLKLWHASADKYSVYPPMLASPDYLALGTAVRWAYMAGGPRAISGGKSVLLVQNGQAETLTAPQGQEALEPAINPKTGTVAAVLANAEANAAWNLGRSYRQWMQTRTLAVWTQGRWTRWSKAGAGVTDPVWLADGRGILYLAGNRLWLMRNAHTRPQLVLGPIPSSGGYYGQVIRSSLWSLHS